MLIRIRKILLIVIFMIIVIIILFFGWMAIVSRGETRPIRDENGEIHPNSIAQVRQVMINGFEQYMLIRGKDRANPILLILHGGPGSPEATPLNKYNSILEDYFIVVNWDQRGAGGSYCPKMDTSDLSIDIMIDDAEKVVSRLKKEFNKEKIFVLGHSWGTYLGMRLIHKSPGDFYAYVGVGQVGDLHQSELESYHFALEQARKENCRRAVKQLEEIRPPAKGENPREVDDVIIQRKWVRKYGGQIYKMSTLQMAGFYLDMLPYREYTLRDKINYFKGGNLSIRALWGELMRNQLPDLVREVRVPVYILQGVHDYQTGFKQARAYFNLLSAPYKEFIPFRESAHYVPFNREVEKFNQIMIKKIRSLSAE